VTETNGEKRAQKWVNCAAKNKIKRFPSNNCKEYN
jgi:hypothetical protein